MQYDKKRLLCNVKAILETYQQIQMVVSKPNQINLILTKTLLIMKKETQKKVKMQAKYRPSLKRFGGYKEVPWLTISGNWLAKAGFSIGSSVEIIPAENQLIMAAD